MLNIRSNTRCKTETRLAKDRKKMFKIKCKLNQTLCVCLLSLSGSAYAASGSVEETTTYVDSVNEWGAWELGLEPAAGGSAPSPSRALASRSANVVFRPKDTNAFSPNIKPFPFSGPGLGPDNPACARGFC